MSSPARGAGSSEGVSEITSASAGLRKLRNLRKLEQGGNTFAAFASFAALPTPK